MRFVLVCTKPDLFVRLVLFPEQSRKGSSLFAQRLVFSFVSFQLSIVNFLFAQRLVVGKKSRCIACRGNVHHRIVQLCKKQSVTGATGDNQLCKMSTINAVHQSIESPQNCTACVKSWKTANKLQLNDSKTEDRSYFQTKRLSTVFCLSFTSDMPMSHLSLLCYKCRCCPVFSPNPQYATNVGVALY